MRAFTHNASATAALTLLLATGCIALPLERDNYFDGGAGTRFVVAGVPDTINSVGEFFDLDVTTDPAPPRSDVAVLAQIVVGSAVLAPDGVYRFRSRPGLGLLPVRAVIRLSILGVADGPTLDLPVILRQRPRSATLSCASLEPCHTLALDDERVLRFVLRDSLGVLVNLPAGVFRYGEAVSRAPAVATVVERPTPNEIRVRGVGAGSTWIVYRSDTGAVDSLAVTVLP